MRNRKITSMVAVGVSLMVIGFAGASQVERAGENGCEEVTVASYESGNGLSVEKREQVMVSMAMQEQQAKDALGIGETELESEIQTQPETELVTEEVTEPVTEEVTEPETEQETKSEFSDIAIAQVNDYVNVRSQSNTDSEIVGKLYNNSAATILAEENGWYQISSGSVVGYVKSEFVVVGDENLAKQVATRYATVNTETLFVRSEPTTESSIIYMLPEGDDLVAIDESNPGWIKVLSLIHI